MNETSKPTKTDLLRRAAVRATLAPSVHNTQPWRFVLSPDALEIHADWNRQLQILDPTRRQLLISCGCAVFNARVSLAAAGFEAIVERMPDAARPQIVARLTVGDHSADGDPIGRLDAVINLRQTNRRRYAEEEVPAEVIDELIQIVSAEGAQLFHIREMEHRLITARLSQQADAIENIDPAYRAELRAWTSDNAERRDGVAAVAVPHVDAGSEDDIPIRDFDTRGMGWLPTATHSSVRQCLFLLGTHEETPGAWLLAGEALERLWLEATRHGYVASLLTQVIEVPRTRELLRHELKLSMYPHVLLRIGRAPVTPTSRRRRLGDVLIEREADSIRGRPSRD